METFDEVVEVSGHLIDSGIMSRILDEINKAQAEYEIVKFTVGRTNEDPSLAQIRISSGSEPALRQTLENVIGIGGYIRDSQDARLVPAEKNACVPDDFYSSTNHKTQIRLGGNWTLVSDQRMDACIIVDDDQPRCRKLRDIKAGDMVVCGMEGVKVIPESRVRDRQEFVFMDSETSSEKKIILGVRQLARLIQESGGAVLVAGPVVVHTGGVEPLAQLIRQGYVQALLGGNAIAVHDIENALYSTSLGVDLNTGIPVAHGHKNHMRAINAVNRCGSIAAAVEQGVLKSGIMYELVKNNVPFALAGSIRDDGPLPDVINDMIKAQEAYSKLLKDARIVIMLSTMLHSIGTGNMIRSEVKTVCVDINPAVVTKLVDRGSAQAIGLVTDVGLFLTLLARELAPK